MTTIWFQTNLPQPNAASKERTGRSTREEVHLRHSAISPPCPRAHETNGNIVPSDGLIGFYGGLMGSNGI